MKAKLFLLLTASGLCLSLAQPRTNQTSPRRSLPRVEAFLKRRGFALFRE